MSARCTPNGPSIGYQSTARAWIVGAVLAIGCVLNPAHSAAGGPAVSAVNGKLDLQGGASNGTGTALTEGSLSVPLGRNFGLQVDGALGKREPQNVGGTGGHLFWRDPDLGLMGLVTERIWIGDRFFNRAGAEGELYESRWTLAGAAGYQNGLVPHSLYTKLDLRLYLTEDLMISPGIHQSGGRYLGRGSIEWQAGSIGRTGLALFADAGAGTHGTGFIVAGVRLYFGAAKSLKRRHREDDPPNSLGGDLLDNAGFIHSSTPSATSNSGSDGGGGGGGGPCHGPSCGVGGPA